MGTIHFLLHPDERLLVACFEELGRFRRSYDSAILDALRTSFAPRCGAQAEEIVSQALLVDRILGLAGVTAMPDEQQNGATLTDPDASLRLLAVVEAAQTSRQRLETMFTGGRRFDSGGIGLILRFGALLLHCGLRLPAREACAGTRPASRGLRPRAVETRRAV